MVITATLSVSQTALAPPLQAAPQKTATDLPGLPSEPAALSSPVSPVGDFSNPPDPSLPPSRSTPRPSSFDPAKSIPLDDETTPTRRVYLDPAGTNTAVISERPVRYQEAATGAWIDIDHTLAPAPDGSLAARSAPTAPTLGARADGAVATVQTAAGPIVLRHPQAGAVEAQAEEATATYPKALSGSRDW